MLCIHARIQSFGGVVLGGLFLVLIAILWIVVHLPAHAPWLEATIVCFVVIMTIYVVDGASESLTLQDDALTFDGWFTRRRRMVLTDVVQVLLVHEGLNTEWGIETLTCMRRDGNDERLALGPLWRRRDLEVFLRELEATLHDQKIVEEVR